MLLRLGEDSNLRIRVSNAVTLALVVDFYESTLFVKDVVVQLVLDTARLYPNCCVKVVRERAAARSSGSKDVAGHIAILAAAGENHAIARLLKAVKNVVMNTCCAAPVEQDRRSVLALII